MAFIYLTGFLVSLFLRVTCPSLSRLLDVIDMVCLSGIVFFGALEIRALSKRP